jgi:hypothetical protein
MESQTEYPSKNYPTKSGETLTSQEYAEVLAEAIEHYKNQMQSTTDAREIKKLKDKVRAIKIFINQHDDVKRHMP